MQFVGIDVGRDQVKVVTAGKRLSFKSKVGEWRERKLSSGGDYEVEINEQKYFIAELAEESFFAREMATENKIHEETKILFLSALGIIANPGLVNIVTGVPISQHTTHIKQKLTELLHGLHQIKINSIDGNYRIEQIDMAPESGAAFWDAILDDKGRICNTWLSQQKVRVVDIGSRTVNYCTINNRKYLDRDSGTLNYGIFELHNAEVVPSKSAKEQFARKVVADISKKWLNYEPDEDIVFLTGGGALLLEEWLTNMFTVTQMAEDPLFANALGYWKMGVAKWAAKSVVS